jgi:putative photosynthetic complex assembly protein 2
MSLYLLPVGFALFVWWFSTGLIIFLDHLPQRTFPYSLLAASVLCGFAFHGLSRISQDTSVPAAYAGFVCALVVWGWQEMSFLMGIITGPRRKACPHDCHGLAHFIHGVQVVIYHELAIAVGAAAIIGFSWGGANQVATSTYVILWGMRISAKLNLFAGVRNVSEKFLPDHLRYLGSFFRQRPMNALMPVSLTAGIVLSVLLIQRAAAPLATPFEAISATFLAAMMVLGVIEHWFLIIPVPFEALWNWYLRAREVAKPVVHRAVDEVVPESGSVAVLSAPTTFRTAS